jgi:hypothetical protein
MTEKLNQKDFELMHEAALLSPNDEVRKRCESLVKEKGEVAERIWLKMLKEDETFRIQLNQVEEPEGLNERLLSISQDTNENHFNVMNLLRTAALILFAYAVGFWSNSVSDSPDAQNDIVNQLSALAVNDYTKMSKNMTHHVNLENKGSNNKRDFVQYAKFNPGENYVFQSAELTEWTGRKVLRCIWQRGDESIVVFQVLDPYINKLVDSLSNQFICCGVEVEGEHASDVEIIKGVEHAVIKVGKHGSFKPHSKSISI